MLGLGISYRHADAVVGMLEIQISPKLRLGYSYDYTISDFRAYNKGTHEVMLRWEIPNSGYSRKGLVTKDTGR